jgi:hypothetical protein
MSTWITSLTTYRYGAWLERAMIATALAGAVVASGLLPGYPVEWRAVLSLAVLGLALWSAPVGYFVAVAVVAYPLWFISPYLMVLFLGLAVIPHRLILQHLPLALLIIWSPAFISLHLELALPILVGLLGGTRRGAAAGAASALWFKLLAALSGTGLDLLIMQAPPGDPGRIAERFAGRGSMDTVLLLAAPFAPSSAALLVHVLQVGSWAAAGACAGWLVTWGQRRLLVSDLQDSPPAWRLIGGRFVWTGLVPVLVALLALVLLAFLVPALVARPLGGDQLAVGWDVFAPRTALAGAVLLLLAALIVISQPLPAGTRRWQPWKRPSRQPHRPVARVPEPPPAPALPPLPKIDPNRPFVPSWATNRAPPAALDPPAGGNSPPASAFNGEWWAESSRGTGPPPRPDERDILIELD